jgi:chromosome segregation ATPase
MRLEVSELIELNNSLNEKIDTLTEEKQSAAKEFQSERSLFQQRLDDLKTRNLLTNEECRTLREDLHRVKRELKETIARQEEESLKHAVDGILPQQLETYRQLSESLTRENLKLSTDIAKLGKQISEREGHEKKSMATVKLLLEKNASLESELVTLQERQEQQRRAHEEVAQERDECRHKLTDSMTRCKRAETELRKLQSRVHEEIQNEVSVETERMLLLEEECSRLQKEIFTSRNESNEWEIECLRVTQELSELQESMNANSLKNVSELTHELEAVMEKLQRAEETAEELKAQLKQKETEVAQQREELSASVDVSKSELKEMKRSWKQQLQTAEGKISKMQSEILRLVPLLPLPPSYLASLPPSPSLWLWLLLEH